MILDIEKLRSEKRPLWMTNAGIENYADLLGGGGDLVRDRLHGDWALNHGFEEAEELDPVDIEIALAGRYAGEDYLS